MEKAAIVAELRAPGVTVDDVARRHAMSSALLSRWRLTASARCEMHISTRS
jgi:transposase-like protein